MIKRIGFMKDRFQLLIKILSLVVGLLITITLLTTILFGTIVMTFNGISSQTSNPIASAGTEVIPVAADTYRGVISKEGLSNAPLNWE